MKQEIIVGYKYGQPIVEEGVVIKTADPRITGKILEIDGKFVVKGDEPGKVKWFNKLSEAIQYCQPVTQRW